MKFKVGDKIILKRNGEQGEIRTIYIPPYQKGYRYEVQFEDRGCLTVSEYDMTKMEMPKTKEFESIWDKLAE